jgi:serine/threonine protein kinase
MTSQTVKRLGNYEIVKKLGSGTFGTVYLSTDNKALKVLNGHPLDQNVVRECINANSVVGISKYIAEVEHGFFADNGKGGYSLVLVFDYIPFGFESYMNVSAEQRLKAIQYFAPQLLEGVRDMHYRGIFHRDIKPDNILIKKVGDEKIVQIIDFGLNKWNLDAYQTFYYDCCTLWSRSPEVLTEPGTRVDFRAADMWSIGMCVLYLVYGDYCLWDIRTKQDLLAWINEYIATKELHLYKSYDPIFEPIVQSLYTSLLNMDPTKRGAITENIYKTDPGICSKELTAYKYPYDKPKFRENSVMKIWKLCKFHKNMRCFSLAVEIMDRFFNVPDVVYKDFNPNSVPLACVIIADAVCGGNNYVIDYKSNFIAECKLMRLVYIIMSELDYDLHIVNCMHVPPPAQNCPVQLGLECNTQKITCGLWDMRDLLYILKDDKFIADGLSRISKYEEFVSQNFGVGPLYDPI